MSSVSPFVMQIIVFLNPFVLKFDLNSKTAKKNSHIILSIIDRNSDTPPENRDKSALSRGV